MSQTAGRDLVLGAMEYFILALIEKAGLTSLYAFQLNSGASARRNTPSTETARSPAIDSSCGVVGAETTVGLAGSITAMACQTLPHLEQRTLRPVGGMTAAVSKRVLQAGQIMTVIVQNHHRAGFCGLA